jgi:hypothetical protein
MFVQFYAVSDVSVRSYLRASCLESSSCDATCIACHVDASLLFRVARTYLSVPPTTGLSPRRFEGSGGAETGQHPQQGLRPLEAPDGARQAEWHPVP